MSLVLAWHATKVAHISLLQYSLTLGKRLDTKYRRISCIALTCHSFVELKVILVVPGIHPQVRAQACEELLGW